MAKKSKELAPAETIIEDAIHLNRGDGVETKKGNIDSLAQEFGNGDLNILRDKINEIIKAL